VDYKLKALHVSAPPLCPHPAQPARPWPIIGLLPKNRGITPLACVGKWSGVLARYVPLHWLRVNRKPVGIR
jgi:hypothetical protein